MTAEPAPALTAIRNFLALFAATQGLDMQALGAATVHAAIRDRMRTTGSDARAYRRLLERDAAEAAQLLAHVLVPETWFFRDTSAFELLRSAAFEYGRADHRDPFRVLSLACSTGEEVWSIAIVLHEAGLLPSQLRVDALDLSETAVAAARRAIYGRRSFRGQPLGAREQYFLALSDDQRQVAATLHASVRIETGNLLDAPWAQAGRRYHAIFCRNAMIYMTASARQSLVERVKAALSPGGLFFVGHADALCASAADFRRHPTPGAFAWVRQAPDCAVAGAAASPRQFAARHRQPGRAAPALLAGLVRTAAPPGPVTGRHPATIVPSKTVNAIRQLADNGQYAAAEHACRSWLRYHPLDTDALSLLGLIAMATGRDDEAHHYLRKTLYLDPTHAEGRALMASLSQTNRALRMNVRDDAPPARARTVR